MQCGFIDEIHEVVFSAEQEELFRVIWENLAIEFQDSRASMKYEDSAAHKSTNARIDCREYFVFPCGLSDRSHGLEALILKVGVPLWINKLE